MNVKNIKRERLECHLYGQLIGILLCSSTMFQMRQLLLEKKKQELSEYKAIYMINTIGNKTILAIHKTFLIWTTGEPSSNFSIRIKDNAKLIAARMSNTLPNILPETFIIPCVGHDKITIPNTMLTISNLLAFFLKSNTKNTNVKIGTIAISIDASLTLLQLSNTFIFIFCLTAPIVFLLRNQISFIIV
jgi:hypothetical protein